MSYYMNELIELYEKILNGNASRHEIIDFLMSYESASMGSQLFIRMVTKKRHVTDDDVDQFTRYLLSLID